MSIPQPDDGIKEGDSVIGTDENRAVLHVEVIFWSGKRKIPPSLVSGKYCPHFVVTGTTEYLGVCFLDGTECTFDTPALGNAQPLYPDTIDYEDEKATFEPDEADTVELINGERMPWEQAKRDGIDYIALYYVNEKGKPVQILDAELA